MKAVEIGSLPLNKTFRTVKGSKYTFRVDSQKTGYTWYQSYTTGKLLFSRNSKKVYITKEFSKDIG